MASDHGAKEAVSELLAAQHKKIDVYLMRTKSLTGWSMEEISLLCLASVEEPGLLTFAQMVMDVLVLTICAETGIESHSSFSDKVAVIFGEKAFEHNLQSRVHGSLSAAVRVPLRDKGFSMFSSKASKSKGPSASVCDPTQLRRGLRR